MATKKRKQRIDQELEANLVALMVDSHEALGVLNTRIKTELNSLISDFIIEVASIPQGATYQVYQLTEQLNMDISTLLEPYLNQYIDMATEAHDEAVEMVSGHFSESYVVNNVESLTDNSIMAQQAREKTVNILMVWISQLSDQALRISQNGVSAGLIDDLTSSKDSLIYELRRHFEAFMSYAINNGVSQSASLSGYTHYFWQIRPELTRSGTCEVCKAHSQGGINHDGVYTLDDVPMIPVHPHCVCILIPIK